MRPLDRENVSGGPVRSLGSGRDICNDVANTGLLNYAALRQLVLALGGVGLISGLMAGCAATGDVGGAKSSEMTPPQVHAMELITRSAQTPEGYYDLGKYYFWQNRFDKARDAFMQAVRLNPGNADVLNGLGATYDKLGQYEAAQQAYKAALLKEPDAEHVLANMGYSLLLQGKNDEAAHYLREAVRLNPSDMVAQRHLVQAGRSKTYADTRIAPDNPLAMVQRENALREELVGGSSSHEETATARQVAEVSPVIKQEVSIGADAVSEPVATGVSAKALHPTGMVKSVVVADSRGGVSLPIKQPALPRVITEKLAPESRQNLSQPGVPPTQNPLSARLEISNGNGVTGMARAISAGLRKQGANVARVTDKRPFVSSRTVIICSEAWSEQAKSLARLLPNSPKVVVGSIAHRRVDIRVILGADAALAWKGNGVKPVLVAAI